MDHFNVMFAIGMEFYVQTFAWVDAYLACGRDTSDDTPFSMFQYGRSQSISQGGGEGENITIWRIFWIWHSRAVVVERYSV